MQHFLCHILFYCQQSFLTSLLFDIQEQKNPKDILGIKIRVGLGSVHTEPWKADVDSLVPFTLKWVADQFERSIMLDMSLIVKFDTRRQN